MNKNRINSLLKNKNHYVYKHDNIEFKKFENIIYVKNQDILFMKILENEVQFRIQKIPSKIQRKWINKFIYPIKLKRRSNYNILFDPVSLTEKIVQTNDWYSVQLGTYNELQKL